MLTATSTVKKQLELSSVTQEQSSTSETSGYEQEKQDQDKTKSLPREELVSLLSEFCCESLGRGVVGINELKDKLLLKQSSVVTDHPLRMCGVSDSLMLSAIDTCGAMQVGQAVGKRLYALTHGDKVGCNEHLLQFEQTG